MTTPKQFATLSDEEIVRRFQQTTDPRLFTELVQRHHTFIQKACYQHLKDREAVKDVSQEVLLRVYTKIDTYRHEAPFSAWLQTIIRNRCVDHLRENKKLMHQEISQQIAETLQEELDTDSLEKPLEEYLTTWLEKVSGQEKILLQLKYGEGLSYQEIQQHWV